MSEVIKDPRMGRVQSDNADALLSMLGSKELLEAEELSHSIIVSLISDILKGDPESWNVVADWIAQCATGTSLQRWAALSEATLLARNTFYAINKRAPSQESEEEIQELFSIFDAKTNEMQIGVRDGLFMLSLTTSENQILEPDWLWYSTSDCANERFMGATIIMFYSIASSLSQLASYSDLEPVELWQTFSLLIS